MSDDKSKTGRLPLTTVQSRANAKGLPVPNDGDLALVRRMQAVSRMYRMFEVAEYREKVASAARERALAESEAVLCRQAQTLGGTTLLGVPEIRSIFAKLRGQESGT